FQGPEPNKNFSLTRQFTKTKTAKRHSSIPLLSKPPAPIPSSSLASIPAPTRPPCTSSPPNHQQRHQRRTPNCTHPLITVTVSVSGLSASSEVSASFTMALEESWDAVASTPTPLLAPLPVHSPSLIVPRTAAVAELRDTRTSSTKTNRKLVPEKSKPRLSILSMGMGMGMGLGFTAHDRKSEERVKDLSDVMRRVGLSESSLIKDTSCTYAYATDGKGGFGIYVDPSHVDPDIV
ncbi:hypothetical protein CVT25_002723, partial [Psilocybe cyanescens]